MSEEGTRLIRRIAVALDSSGPSLAAAAESASLAARLQAELAGLFVEDINLLNVSALPFMRELGAFSAARRPLATESLVRMLRGQATRAEQALAQHARALGITWSFRVARGQVPVELLAAAAQADLLALGIMRRTRQLGETLRAVLAATERPVLLLPEGSGLRPPVTVLIDEQSPLVRMIALALQLPFEGEELIRVRLSAASEAALSALEQQLSTIAPVDRITIEQRALTSLSESLRVRPPARSGVLLLAATGEAGTSHLHDLVCRGECALLLVR